MLCRIARIKHNRCVVLRSLLSLALAVTIAATGDKEGQGTCVCRPSRVVSTDIMACSLAWHLGD